LKLKTTHNVYVGAIANETHCFALLVRQAFSNSKLPIICSQPAHYSLLVSRESAVGWTEELRVDNDSGIDGNYESLVTSSTLSARVCMVKVIYITPPQVIYNFSSFHPEPDALDESIHLRGAEASAERAGDIFSEPEPYKMGLGIEMSLPEPFREATPDD